MVKPGSPRGDEARNGALVLLCRPRSGPGGLGSVAGIEVLKELELAIAHRDEGYPEPAHGLRRPRLIDHAVLVRGEALDGDPHLQVGLGALQRKAQTPA